MEFANSIQKTKIMYKSLSKIVITITILLSFTTSNAQIKNEKTESVKIYGNCEMCKKVIEKAGNFKKIAMVNWNSDSKMATLTYDSKKTNQDEILKRIALSGYDSDKFLAPDNVYNNLPSCCQYKRVAKVPVKTEVVTEIHENHTEMPKTEVQETNQLKAVFDNYFSVKDALVQTDGASASTKSAELLLAINSVKMEMLEMNVHMVWMKVLDKLKTDAENISKNKDVAKQRDQFNSLTKNIYALLKVSKVNQTIYYDYCPMKDANWLSKESAIKNPYYGSQMMSCGKTVETIK